MINENSNLKVLSLFSGCGGMDLGFEGDFHVLRKSINVMARIVTDDHYLVPKAVSK